jgi:hypothetical protein
MLMPYRQKEGKKRNSIDIYALRAKEKNVILLLLMSYRQMKK